MKYRHSPARHHHGMQHTDILLTGCVLLLLMAHASPAFELSSERLTVDIHGFLSQGFLLSDRNEFYAETEDGTFQFNEFGINFSSDLSDRLRVGLQFLSRDLGEMGNNTIELDWAYGRYRWKDWLGISAGLIKVPWGLYNETRDMDMLRTSIFLPRSLYDEESRSAYNSILGVGIGGDLYLSPVGSVSYQVITGEEDLTQYNQDAEWLPADIELVETRVKNVIGSALDWGTPVDGLRLGVNLGRYDGDEAFRYSGDIPEEFEEEFDSNDIIRSEWGTTTYFIASAEYTWNDVILAAEYVREEETDGDREEGYYAKFSYRITDWFEWGGYYSAHYPDGADKDGQTLAEEDGVPRYYGWQKEFVLTTRFDFNEFWVLKMEGHLVDGVADIWRGSVDEAAGFLDEHSFLFAIKTTLSF